MKTETCKLYSRVFLNILPNVNKIYPYNFELNRFKVGDFLKHSVETMFRPNTMHTDSAHYLTVFVMQPGIFIS